MTEALKASDGSLFVQLAPGDAPSYIGCVDVAALPDPRGAVTLLRCRDANGNYRTVGETQGEPDVVTTTITAWLYPEADILDRLADKQCRANLYVLLRDCGKLGQFTNWARAEVLHHARLTNITGNNLAMRVAPDPATRALELTGWGVHHLRNKIAISRLAIAETTDLNAIALDKDVICAGDCGDTRELCEVGFLAGDAPAGSPTDRADVWQTANGGTTWTNVTGAAGHPFVAGQDVIAVALFALDGNTKRMLAVREAVTGEPLKISYSDDEGVTWTLATVGVTNNEGIAGAKALYVLDRNNLWLATTGGNIFFSSDGGLTWAAQASALSASGAVQLNAVQFIDEDNGFAVGENGTIIKTTDGGLTWADISDPTGGDDIKALAVFSAFRIMVGSNTDKLYHTRNAGDTWSAKTFAGQSTNGTIAVLERVNDEVVWMAHNPLTGQGYVLRSIDGGHTWQRYTTPTNSGINDFVACDSNNGFAVGNANSATGFVAKVTA